MSNLDQQPSKTARKTMPTVVGAVCGMFLFVPITGAFAEMHGLELEGDTELREIRAQSNQVFDDLAGDDGVITRQDLAAADIDFGGVSEAERADLKDELFSALDIDGDGVVTREEWEERLFSDLSAIDADGDGRVTLQELATARDDLSIWEALGLSF